MTTMPALMNLTVQQNQLRQTSAVVEKKGLKAGLKRNVSFKPSVSVQEIPHIADMKKEEVEATWYSREEFKELKEAVYLVLRKMVNGGLSADECTRGLEHRTPEGATRRKQNKLNAFQVVWNAQESQWEDNISDPEAISIVYQMQTYKSRETSVKLGLHDAMVAKEEHPNIEYIDKQVKVLLAQ